MKKTCSWCSLVLCLAVAGQQALAQDTGVLTSRPPRGGYQVVPPPAPCLTPAPGMPYYPPASMPSTGTTPPSTGTTPPSTGTTPPSTGTTPPSTDATTPPSQAANDAFSQPTPGGSEVASSFNPTMMGDLMLTHPRFATRSSSSSSSRTLDGYVARSSFKIADGESPKPLDRVFFNYNYYNNVDPNGRFPGSGATDIHRELFGFEKTCLDGNASIGMRVPIFQITNGGRDLFGDVSVILKYAFVNDCKTGDVLSAGLVVTAPTSGIGISTGTGNINDVLLQPWVGGVLNLDRAYVHAFSSVVVPTDSNDATILFNDIGFGYYLRRGGDCDSLITAIIPTTELHITTPLSHRGSLSSPVGVPDILDVTSGAHIVLHNNLWLSVGSSFPLTGPKPFDFELLAQVNYRF